MVILRARGNESRNLLIRGAAYDIVHQRTILPIQEIKADEMEMRKRIGLYAFTPAQMNSVLVEMWHLFQQQSALVIIDAFRKTKLLPLAPPDHDTNTQACLASS